MDPRWLASFLVGLLFSLGLGVSGMTQPSKVVGFLDLTGGWDPSLGVVLGSSVLVHAVSFWFITRRASPMFDEVFRIPTRTDITPRLVVGSALFGIGWGLGGYCPGPGIVSATSGSFDALLFTSAMIVGMVAFQVVENSLARRASAAG